MRSSDWTRREGWSDARVYEVTHPSGTRMFVKVEPDGTDDEAAMEAERLAWLRTTGIPCPETMFAGRGDGAFWLVTGALPGSDLRAGAGRSPRCVVQVAAAAMRRLHALPLECCPFDQRAERRIAEARRRMREGLVDGSLFDPVRQSMPVPILYDQLLVHRPETEDLVVAHGDAGLGNMLMESGRFTGFVDIGRLGVADRHQDLALLARDIVDDLGEEWLALFFQLYGRQPDPARMDFYRLLDEFF